MRSILGLVLLVSAVSAFSSVAACSGASNANVAPGAGNPDGGPAVGPDGNPITGKLPCEVDKVLADNCRSCHASPPLFGSLMPLVTLADLQAPARSDASRKVYELVADRIAFDPLPMPPTPNARLSAADRATLTSWAGAGAPAAPAGAADCTTTPAKPDAGVTCKPDLSIGPGAPYTMPADLSEEYVCYGVELTRSTPTHVTAFAPRIDNPKIVHHVVLFEADAAYSPTPTKCSSGGSLQWRMVMGWAPGGKGLEMPPEAGFPLKTTGATHYVVQMHYANPLALADQTDQSGFDLCTSAPRQYEADVLAFGTQQFTIPAGAVNYDRNCSITVPSQLSGLHLIASMPHMHKLGTAMTTQLFAGGAGGPASDLGTIANWSFATQAWLAINGAPGDSGVVTKTNDVISTKCTWTNTTGADVSFGEKTVQEMCYSFTVYYPRVNSTIWSWAAPALTSQCQ